MAHLSRASQCAAQLSSSVSFCFAPTCQRSLKAETDVIRVAAGVQNCCELMTVACKSPASNGLVSDATPACDCDLQICLKLAAAANGISVGHDDCDVDDDDDD